MSATWHDTPPPPVRIGAAGTLRILARGIPMAILVFGGLFVLLAVRLVERPVCGLHRPVTPAITQVVCKGALAILGLKVRRTGTAMTQPGAIVANHSSWLDIFVLNACDRVYFVSKSEVADWPGIGWLARATGTVFIRRNRREAGRQRDQFTERLDAGHRLLFFPEGTSTDGRRVLDFKSTLFGAFFTEKTNVDLHLQPVTLVYRTPVGVDARFYGWWGDMDFASHLLRMLAAPRHGIVEVIHGAPHPVAAFATRKDIARDLGTKVRTTLETRLESYP